MVVLDVFPSNLIEEQPLQSISEKFEAFHIHIGETLFCGKTSSNLVTEKVFFYQHTYRVPRHDVGGFGKMEIITSPSLWSLEWPALNALRLILMKSKILCDIQGSMKYAKASRSMGFIWVCLIHLFATMFNKFTFSQTATMFVCKM